MTPEQWHQINDLYHASLERGPAERHVFLAHACGEDKVLQREVESLVAAHEEDQDFIEQPVFDAVARLLTTDKPELAAGRQISHYEILAVLGSGGMGEVYLAQDTKLGRQVALKLLPYRFTAEGDRVRRFQQEARSASALNQPNILTIHEIGEVENRHYIATEFIDGQTLREMITSGPLPLGQALEIAIQVANALAAAHESGIIHRDIKPENIMVRRRDHLVKVLDFGLAKLTDEPSDKISMVSSVATHLETDPNMVMGTVSYMSTEQGRRLPVDIRTDVFSLGVVLYEMIAGCRPFQGTTTAEVLISILEKNPTALSTHRPEVPPEMERIVMKALEKDAADRYQTIQEMAADLRSIRHQLPKQVELSGEFEWGQGRVSSGPEWKGINTNQETTTRRNTIRTLPIFSRQHLVSEIKEHKTRMMMAVTLLLLFIVVVGYALFSPTRSSPVESLAIMPFSFSSTDPAVMADPDREYLSDGITESLINNLSQLPEMKVIARGSVFNYKGQQTDPRVIGRALDVQAILIGRIVQRGDTLVINVELVDTRENRHIWGAQYDRALSDLLVVQRDISKQITDQLRLRLTGAEQQQLTRRHTENPEAYQLYLKGRYYWNKRTKESLNRAIEYFHEAIDKDPTYALAYVGLAETHALSGEYDVLEPKGSAPQAKAEALKALEIDDRLNEAYAALAYVRWVYDRDFAGAEHDFKRALEFNPNYATAHQWYAEYLYSIERNDEAMIEMRYAEALDPLSLIIKTDVGITHHFARRYDLALAQFQQVLALDSNFARAHTRLGLVYLEKTMYAEAIAELQKGVDLSGRRTVAVASLAHAYAVSGNHIEAQKLLRELKEHPDGRHVSPLGIALIHVGLGDKEEAFAWLQKSCEEHDPYLVFLFKVEPRFDDLRADSRYASLMQCVGFFNKA
jgi:serine/threonine-protein kinase